MKKILLSALAGLCLLANAASATVYYVWANHPNARDSNAGTSITAPKKTLPSMKTLARPADVIRLYAGNYTWTLFDSAGSNPAGGGYITVIGTHTIADPLADSVARVAININSATEPIGQSYVSVKGVTMQSSLHFGPSSNRDSVTYCTIRGSLENYAGDYNVVENCSFDGNRIEIANQSTASTSLSHSAIGNTHNYNKHWKIGQNTTSGAHLIKLGLNPDEGYVPNWCDSLTMRWNRIYGVLEPGATDMHPMYAFRTRRSDISDNRFEWVVNTPSSHNAAIIRLRDSTYSLTMNRDTILARGPGHGTLYWSTSGGQDSDLEVFECELDSAYINLTGLQGGSESHWYDGMNGWTISNSLIAVGGTAIRAHIVKGANVINQNTLLGSAAAGVVNLELGIGEPALVDTNLTITNNIIAAWNPGSQDPVVDGSASHQHAAMLIGGAKWDSTTAMRFQAGVVAHHNAYSYFGYAQSPGDRSIKIYDNGNHLASSPGDSSATNPRGVFENRWRLDSLSVYGSMKFDEGGPDSTMGLAFDPRLGVGSKAIDAAEGGVDCGAFQHADLPNLRVYPTLLAFSHGTRDTFTVRLYNYGAADAAWTVDCNVNVLLASGSEPSYGKPPSYGGSASGLFHALVAEGISGDPSGSSFTDFNVWYDGVGDAGTTNFWLTTNDTSIPITTPPGCAAGRYLVIPITVNP